MIAPELVGRNCAAQDDAGADASLYGRDEAPRSLARQGFAGPGGSELWRTRVRSRSPDRPARSTTCASGRHPEKHLEAFFRKQLPCVRTDARKDHGAVACRAELGLRSAAQVQRFNVPGARPTRVRRCGYCAKPGYKRAFLHPHSPSAILSASADTATFHRGIVARSPSRSPNAQKNTSRPRSGKRAGTLLQGTAIFRPRWS